MADTKIQWATKVWNPITGCSKVSDGCRHCYAEKIAHRFWGDRKFTDVQCHPERLEEPWHWRKPQRIFVNSMSDLFHESVPFEFIFAVFMYMLPSGANKWANHTFMILTKRPERMAEFINWMTTKDGLRIEWPLPKIWLGVTAENQEMADKRIPVLLQIPAAIRFVSVEPMLSSVRLNRLDKGDYIIDALQGMVYYLGGGRQIKKLDWVIAGPETGPKARPMKREWIESLYEQCKSTGVPFFDKKNVIGLNLKQFPEVSA
jgi:protein gp37